MDPGARLAGAAARLVPQRQLAARPVVAAAAARMAVAPALVVAVAGGRRGRQRAVAAASVLSRPYESWRWTPAPGWPEPPPGWSPSGSWQPDPSWPPPPPGWQWRRPWSSRWLAADVAAIAVLAGVSIGAWDLWMAWGIGNEDYPVWRPTGLILTLLALVVAGSWLGWTKFVVSVVPPALAVAVWFDWNDDETGLFGVGVMMMLTGALVTASSVAVAVTSAHRAALARRPALAQRSG